MKKGLVLEGGGIRGIFSAGVMDVLMEEGIEFDGAIGVSAGAAFGCNYKSRQPRRAIRYNLKYAKDPRYSSVRSLLKTGDLFNAQFCYHDIPEKLYPFDWKTFRENPMQFFLVCTDVETGKPVYHLCDNDSDWQMLEWFRASGSMPLVSRVVEIGSQKLLDGGISDSIPLRFMENKGYDRNVVILTRPAGYVKEPAPMMRMISRVLQQYPEAVKAMENRHNVYNETLAYIRQREAGKFAFVIRPEEDLDVGRIEHDRFKIREAYKAGRRAARKRLNALRRFLDAADNEVFADGTYSTNASIIANAPGAEPLPSDDFLTYEEKTAAEAAPAGEEKAAEKAPSYVGTIEEAIPAPAEEKKNEKDASSFRAQVFGEAIDEQAGFKKPVSFVDRQEAALRRERESAIEAEEAAEKEAAEKAEAERIAAEKAEAEKLAAEKAEEEKIAAEKAEAERIAAEKAEAERIAAEKAEAERIAAEKAEAERIAAEKAEAERIAAEKAEAERIAAEKAEAERIAAEKAEAERIAAEKAEAERIAAEKAEAERIAAEKAEAERIAAEKAEAERIAAEKAEAERIAAEKAEAERIAAEKAEAERIAAEKAEAERIAAEKAEAERIAAEKAEAARIAAEKRAAEKAEAERIAAEKRAAARKAREDMIAAEKAAAEKAAEEKAAAMKAAMERAAAAKASAVTGAKDIAENISEANSPLMLRGRRQKKTWKPGNMTSLKKQEGEEE
ncbi:MAG: patatin family protein [Lachnospiraceae bacterium]|nr:patatin family protein [Lachnospiraceae bacterium]